MHIQSPDAFAPISNLDRETIGHTAAVTDAADKFELHQCPDANPPPHHFKHRNHGLPSTVWTYRNADGAMIFVVARYDILQDDGTSRKEVLPWCYGRKMKTERDRVAWYCNAPPAPRAPYGLDLLAARPDAGVLLVEGEKTAEAAAALFPDMVAVTSQGGSKAASKTDWSALRGRRVTIWRDHDDAGTGYARDVTGLLRQAGASSVRAVSVPYVWPDKWDLADVLPAGVTEDELQALVDDAPISVDHQHVNTPLRTIGLRDLEWSQYRAGAIQTGPVPVQRFTLAPLFPLGTLSVLFGPGGVGKSLVALGLCRAVASRALMDAVGNLDHAVGPLGATVPREAAGASVFLTLEDSRDEIHRRLAAMNPTGADPDAPVFILPAADWIGFDPTIVGPAETGRRVVRTTLADGALDLKGNWQPSDLDVLLDNIEAGTGHAVKLLVLDPAGDFLAGPENDAEYVKVLMRLLRDMAARRHMTIILVGHVAKGEVTPEGPTMRGSGAWMANSRAAYALWPPDRKTAGELAAKTGAPPEHLVFGMLQKANHAGAPIGKRQLFKRDATSGRLNDITHMLQPTAPIDDDVLLTAIVAACAEAAAAGMPYAEHAIGGLYDQRDDLPPMLACLSKAKLAELSGAALLAGRLVKAKITSAGAMKFLDEPNGTLARGQTVDARTGSRREAIVRHRASLAFQTFLGDGK